MTAFVGLVISIGHVHIVILKQPETVTYAVSRGIGWSFRTTALRHLPLREATPQSVPSHLASSCESPTNHF